MTHVSTAYGRKKILDFYCGDYFFYFIFFFQALKATKLVLDMSVETLRLNPSTPSEISSSAADKDRESSLIAPEIIVRDMGRVKRARGRRNGPLAQV